jgi:hypothetical protein
MHLTSRSIAESCKYFCALAYLRGRFLKKTRSATAERVLQGHQPGVADFRNHLEAVVALEMMTSTRRFCWRPVDVSLPAAGEPSPWPDVESRLDCMH